MKLDQQNKVHLENLAYKFSKTITPHQTNFNNTKSSKYFSKNNDYTNDNLTVTSNTSTIKINFGTLQSTNSIYETSGICNVYNPCLTTNNICSNLHKNERKLQNNENNVVNINDIDIINQSKPKLEENDKFIKVNKINKLCILNVLIDLYY